MNPDFHGIYHMFVRIRPDNIPATIELLRETWREVAPNESFYYSFLDEKLDRQYRAEERWRTIVGYACIFAISISCMGILGLASLAVSRRTKEIGIRKVLGATVPKVVGLLSKDFMKLLLVANVVAWPGAYFLMSQWLQNFAYRISLGIWIFLLTGVLALVIALATVSFQSIRAALANPVEALRYE